MKLFIDNCLPHVLATAMNAVVEASGREVTALRHKFPMNTSDVDWIHALGREGGWAVLSDDHRIRRLKAEREAWRRSGLLGFFLAPGWRKRTTVEKAGHLLLWWPRLVEAGRLHQGGSMLEIPAGKSSRFCQLPY